MIDFQFSTKTKIVISVVALTTAFAAGRYSVSAPEIKTQETAKTNETDNKITETKKHTETTTTKEPNGETKTVVSQDEDTTVKDATSETQVVQTVQAIIPQKTNTLNVSAMIGYNLFQPVSNPPAGLIVTKQFIGPVTIGVFGMSNGMIGGTLGWNF